MPDDGAITVATAITLQERGDYATAEQAFRELLRADPLNIDLLVRHGAVLINLRRNDEAEQTLARAAILAPDNPDVCAYRGLAQYNLGQVAQGAENCAKAVASAPHRADLSALWAAAKSHPCLAVRDVGILQSAHAPTRQVFMSAVVDIAGRAGQPLRILEIGSYMGASLLTWAHAVQRLHRGPASIVCVDSWTADPRCPYPQINHALRSNQAFSIFVHNAEVARKHLDVKIIRGPSAETLPMLRAEQFDIVYVDACHFYREAFEDIAEGKRLVSPGGILCGDDLELQADDCDLAFARANQATDFIQDPRSGIYFHPGVTLAVKASFEQVSCFDGFWAVRKAADRFELLSLAKARGVLPPHWPDEQLRQIKDYFATSKEIAALV